MKNKWIALTVGCIAVAHVGFAATNDYASLTDAQRKELFMQRTGGMLEVPGKGWIGVANGQSRASETEVRYCVKWLGDILNMQCRYVPLKAPFDVCTANSTLTNVGANAILFVAEDRQLPMSLIAPEAKWAMVNTVCFDTSDILTFTNRFEKEIARAAGLLLGSGISTDPVSVMKPVFSDKDIDSLKGETWMNDDLPGIWQKTEAMGITRNGIISYRAACLKGFAPAPTNEYQRAIYEGVKNGTIKPRHKRKEIQ